MRVAIAVAAIVAITAIMLSLPIVVAQRKVVARNVEAEIGMCGVVPIA